jgi:hypothetical protein
MDSNKTIVITVESTQVTSGHSCPLHNLQIILYSYYVILWKDPLPFHLQCISAFFFTARQGRKLSSHRALTRIGSWIKLWQLVHGKSEIQFGYIEYWCQIYVRYLNVLWCTSSNFLSFGKKLQWVYSNGSISPHLMVRSPCLLEMTHVLPVLMPYSPGNSQLNPSYRRTFWCTFLYSNMDGQFAKWRLFPTRWGSLDFKKGAPSTLSSSLNHSCLPPSSGCSGPRLDPNTCQKKCQKKCQKECQNRCHIMQEYARYHVRIDV